MFLPFKPTLHGCKTPAICLVIYYKMPGYLLQTELI